MAARVSVVLPTYREAASLPHLVPRIAASLATVTSSYEIVVVDDASDDGTADVCRDLTGRHPVRLIVREDERGLATAVLRGFDEATGETLVAMDADLSHPPEVIPTLLACLDGDACEFAIGSRYVPGGSTEEGRGVLRWLNSKAATLLARPLTRAKDPMSGFFALRRETYARAAPLSPIGYKIGLELIVKCRVRRVREVPIRFLRRRYGRSKLDLRTRLAYLLHLGRLYAHALLKRGGHRK